VIATSSVCGNSDFNVRVSLVLSDSTIPSRVTACLCYCHDGELFTL